MGVAEQIRAALVQEFSPSEVEVRDDSEAHRGHAGYQEGGESHFHVVIAADALAPLSRIARHRAIHSAIGPELIGRIHALSIEIK
jgi:BolA protein